MISNGHLRAGAPLINCWLTHRLSRSIFCHKLMSF